MRRFDILPYGLAAQSARRQPKNQRYCGKARQGGV
jgi:hypothetical protein